MFRFFISLMILLTLHIQPLKGFTHYGERANGMSTWVVIHNDSSRSVHITLETLRQRRLSYHYYITRSGTIYNLVDTALQAKHAGISQYDHLVDWNTFSLGICLENDPPQSYTNIQYIRLNQLLTMLKKTYPDIERGHIVGHQTIAWPRGRKHDPGPKFQWNRIKIGP